MYHHILTPIDFQLAEAGVSPAARRLASDPGAIVHALYFIPTRVVPRRGNSASIDNVQSDIDKLASSLGTNVQREVRQGALVESVLAYAETNPVDVIVVDEGCCGLSASAFRAAVSRLLAKTKLPVFTIQQAPQGSRSRLMEAATALSDRYGSHVAGDHEPLRHEIQKCVTESLSLSDKDADQLFSELEAAGILKWQQGRENQQDGWEITFPEDEHLKIKFEEVDSPTERSPALDLLKHAIAGDATDIHFDPSPNAEDSHTVRFRIDGRMREYCSLHGDIARTVIKQLKVMSDVSLADPFQPSEGRLRLPASIPNYEVRITTAPVVNGEAVALRLIDCDKLYRPLSEFGLSANSFAAVYEMLHQRSGLVLVAGPTGAGKTTTAYSILNVLFTEQQNIVSIEDPVELVVPFMRQLSVDKRHGFTMEVALSTILRMDPDVLFVGEIRSSEAARVAIQAAASGKRAFSTIHLRDCASTLSAMREREIDSKTLADNVSGVITQRLIRRLCTNCSCSGATTRFEREMFESCGVEAPDEVMQPRGCEDCGHTGYNGRIGIFEAVVVNDELAEAIRRNETEAALRNLIQDAGTPSVIADGLGKVRDGITSVKEVQEVSWLPNSMPQFGSDVIPLYERGAPYKKAARPIKG